ncbi:MAG: MHFG family PEP-CTERM protein [Rubrivivax sp.]|nr:MHFG family PEP-CTERM protein [Rubrivivax sp.]
MSLLFAAALAVSATTLPACSWDRPGADPYMGNVVTAVDRYSDIPESVRAALKKRMAARQYDDIAVIRRDTVVGQHLYSPELRDMHFGQGRVCRTVTRAQWTPTTEERGLVYCESGHCIIVPTVCRNVSRVTRLPPARTAAAATGDPAVAGGALPSAAESPAAPEPKSTAEAESDELQFEAPGAGQSFAQQADAAQPARIVSLLPGVDSGDAAVEGGPVRVADGGPGSGVGPRPIDAGGVARSSGGGGVPFIDLPSTDGSKGGGAEITPMPEGPIGPLRPGPAELPPDPVTLVPEPGLWALWLLGLATLAVAVRRRRLIKP